MNRSQPRKRKELKKNAVKQIKEEDEDDQYPLSSAGRTQMDKENCNEDLSGVECKEEKILLSRSPPRPPKLPRSQPGGALLLQEAMEVEYPRFIAMSLETPRTSLGRISQRLLEARPHSLEKKCLIKESRTMLASAPNSEDFSTPIKRRPLVSSASGKEVKEPESSGRVSSRIGRSVSMSTATNDHQMIPDNSRQQRLKGNNSTVTSETANHPASQLTKLRSQQRSPVKKEHITEVVKEDHQRNQSTQLNSGSVSEAQPSTSVKEAKLEDSFERPSSAAEIQNTEQREVEAAPELKFDASSLKPADLSVFEVKGINLLDFYPSTDPRKFNLDYLVPPLPRPIKLKIYDHQGNSIK